MGRGRGIALLYASILWGLVAVAAEPTPLLPHPANRPVYSQDRYRKEEPPPEPPIDVPIPTYSQDKYSNQGKQSDYVDELRKLPEKGHEWSEIEVAKGAISLNANKLDEAEAHFKTALVKDPRNFVAREYLAEIQERRGDLLEAIALFVKAKHVAPEGRWGMLNYQIGRLYFALKNHERAEAYLRLALKESGHVTASNYLMGYLLYVEGRYFEAERHLHTARMRAIRGGARETERQMLQAINYYLGEIYARLGFSSYAISLLRQTEYGESWEVRNSAWRVHSELNRHSFYLMLMWLAQYDSNVILLPLDTALPSGVSGQSAVGQIFLTRGGWQSSPATPWVGGVDGSFYLNNHFNGSLASFDVANFSFDGWLRWWNRKNFSTDVRYDLNAAYMDRAKFSSFQTTSGPTIAANYFPFERWNWEAGFQYRVNRFANDPSIGPDRRSGHTYVGFGKASIRSPNPRFRPTLGYTFEADATEGENWQARTHLFLLEGDWRVFDRTHLGMGIRYGIVRFPNAIQNRGDSNYQLRFSFTQILSGHWNFLADFIYLKNNSTNPSFAYGRSTFSSGVSYSF